MPSPGPAHDFLVGNWLVQPGLCRVSGPGGTIHVRPKLIDLLVFLASQPGRVVTKDEILQRVWKGEFVVESVLARSIADLRRILDDDAATPGVIETIAKRGYRLIAHVSEIAAPPQAPSIAVLPFANLGPHPDEQYLCDGIAEELTNALAGVPGLRVIARTSAFAFRDRAMDLREVGRQLGVAHLIEGSVQRSEGRLRVTAQLIDASDGCHRWSRRFDGSAHDIFAIQDEISQAIATELEVTLLRRGEPAAPPRSETIDAHDLCLRARHFHALRTTTGLVTAIKYFERAIEKDPSYPPAYSGLAEAHFDRGFLGHEAPATCFPQGLAAARRSLELDATRAPAHAVLGLSAFAYSWDWDGAEREFRCAIDLAPSNALAHLGLSNLLAVQGRLEEATTEAELAQRLDPISPIMCIVVAIRYSEAGLFDRAMESLRTAISMNPALGTVHLHLGRVLWAQGRFEDALDALQRAPSDWLLARGLLGAVLGRLGRSDEARGVLAELEREAATRYVGAVPFALVHQGLGDLDEALRWYTKAFEAREPILTILVRDPVTEILRTDSRFAPLVERMRLPASVSARAATKPGQQQRPRRRQRR